jgi:peptidoglycan/LPS O-acetylase OafA/YrhL
VATIDYKNINSFKGLNALRFFAAYLVLLHHGETIRKKNDLANIEWLGLFRNGENAVTFFFVLSGFLITYLLLKEYNKTLTISVKKFYLKRVLRIWPLYYLLIFIGVILLPIVFTILKVNYEMPYTLMETWHYYVFFFPGLVTFYFGHHFLEPLWSIGVEEVFYLIWAPLFKFCKQRVLILLAAVLVVKLILLGVANAVNNSLFTYIVNLLKFEAMAIGGLGAYFVFYFGNKLNTGVLFKPGVQIGLVMVLLVFLVFNGNINNAVWFALFNTPIFSSILLMFLFLYLIITVALLQGSNSFLNSKALNFLGEISYGIYMYQMLAIFFTIFVVKPFLGKLNIAAATLLFYTIVSALTFIIATLSKRLFEDYFLRLKSKL